MKNNGDMIFFVTIGFCVGIIVGGLTGGILGILWGIFVTPIQASKR